MAWINEETGEVLDSLDQITGETLETNEELIETCESLDRLSSTLDVTSKVVNGILWRKTEIKRKAHKLLEDVKRL